MAYANVDDVELELGRAAGSPVEAAQWSAWLERVERSIVRGFARAGLVLADQVDADDPTEADVKDVEVAAVIRKLQNPAGLTSITRTVDDGTVTTRREGGDVSDPLNVTAVEWQTLLPDASGGAFSTRPGFEADDARWAVRPIQCGLQESQVWSPWI